MSKIVYLLGIFGLSLTSVYATEVSTDSAAGFSLEWMGLILLSITGFIFIFRSAYQIKKIKTLQKELNSYHQSVYSELNTIGDKNV